MNNITINLESALRRTGMSGRALARAVNCHPDTIAKLRRGENQLVSLALLGQICEVLDFPIEQLLRTGKSNDDPIFTDTLSTPVRGNTVSSKTMSDGATQALVILLEKCVQEEHLTWAELSRQCDMSDNYLGSLRRGKLCSYVAARRIAKRLGMDIQSLCNRTLPHSNNGMPVVDVPPVVSAPPQNDTENVVILLREIITLLQRMLALWV